MDDFEVLITIQLASYIGRGESISDESIEPNCSAINNIPPKGVSFSDFICTFAMPCYDFRLFSNCNTKISEKSDTAKSWATFCCSGTYKLI